MRYSQFALKENIPDRGNVDLGALRSLDKVDIDRVIRLQRMGVKILETCDGRNLGMVCFLPQPAPACGPALFRNSEVLEIAFEMVEIRVLDKGLRVDVGNLPVIGIAAIIYRGELGLPAAANIFANLVVPVSSFLR